jgi:hypothetical protein
MLYDELVRGAPAIFGHFLTTMAVIPLFIVLVCSSGDLFAEVVLVLLYLRIKGFSFDRSTQRTAICIDASLGCKQNSVGKMKIDSRLNEILRAYDKYIENADTCTFCCI